MVDDKRFLLWKSLYVNKQSKNCKEIWWGGGGVVMPVNVCNELFCVYMEYPSLNKLSEDYILVAGQKVICKFWKTFDVKISFNIPVDCGNLCNIFFTSH